jgi:hypothetical protein
LTVLETKEFSAAIVSVISPEVSVLLALEEHDERMQAVQINNSIEEIEVNLFIKSPPYRLGNIIHQ